MGFIVNNFFIGIYRRNILKCECLKWIKVFIYKGLRGFWKVWKCVVCVVSVVSVDVMLLFSWYGMVWNGMVWYGMVWYGSC